MFVKSVRFEPQCLKREFFVRNCKGMPPWSGRLKQLGKTPTCGEQVQNGGVHGMMGLLF